MATISIKQKITPFLWYNDQAEEAMKLYCSVFKKAKIISTTPGPNGKIFTGIFQIEEQQFYVINGGPHFSFTPAVSFFVSCKTQKEVDHFWEKLSKGGEKSRCGWLKDKFGLSWQIIPDDLGKLMGDKDPVKAQRVMNAMMKMDKIIISDLKNAYKGK